jgi:hypothetical protein
MNPRLYFGALILSAHDNRLMGSAGIDTDAYPEPTSAADVKRTARRITDRAHSDGDLPSSQYYVVVSWQRYGVPAVTE